MFPYNLAVVEFHPLPCTLAAKGLAAAAVSLMSFSLSMRDWIRASMFSSGFSILSGVDFAVPLARASKRLRQAFWEKSTTGLHEVRRLPHREFWTYVALTFIDFI